MATEGLTVKEVAARLDWSAATVHRLLYGQASAPGLYERIGARTRADAVRWWYTEGATGEEDV